MMTRRDDTTSLDGIRPTVHRKGRGTEISSIMPSSHTFCETSDNTTLFLTQLSRPENAIRFLRIGAELAYRANQRSSRSENRMYDGIANSSPTPTARRGSHQGIGSGVRNTFLG